MTEMSITRALTEVKRIETKLQSEMPGLTFVGYTVGEGGRKKYSQPSMTHEEAAKLMVSNLDSVTDLIARRSKIKALIVASNAVTTIVLDGQTMTVAEAIELKRSVTFMRNLSAVLKSQLMTVERQITVGNTGMLAAIDTAVAQTYGKESKIDREAYDVIARPQIEMKQNAILDPNKLVEHIRALDRKIELVESELDYLLSEANARTVITLA